MKETYRLVDGTPCSLDTLCRREPAWAANAIRSLKKMERAAKAHKKWALRQVDKAEKEEDTEAAEQFEREAEICDRLLDGKKP